MNFPKERQSDLIKLGLGTAAVLFCLWFFIQRPAQVEISNKTKTTSDLDQKIAAKKKIILQTDQVKTELIQRSAQLKEMEVQMVVGDPYLWILKVLREFEIPNQLEFTRYDPPQVIPSIFPPKLSYKTVSFVVAGTAAYHDFGIFLANLENSYQHIRVHRIDIEPIVNKTSSDEKLSFLLELHVLEKPEIKTTAPAPRS